MYITSDLFNRHEPAAVAPPVRGSWLDWRRTSPERAADVLGKRKRSAVVPDEPQVKRTASHIHKAGQLQQLHHHQQLRQEHQQLQQDHQHHHQQGHDDHHQQDHHQQRRADAPPGPDCLAQPFAKPPRGLLPARPPRRRAASYTTTTALPSPARLDRRPAPPQKSTSYPALASPLRPCHVCHKAPKLRTDLEAYADCRRCGGRACHVCARRCEDPRCAGVGAAVICSGCCVESGEDGTVQCLDCLGRDHERADEIMDG